MAPQLSSLSEASAQPSHASDASAESQEEVLVQVQRRPPTQDGQPGKPDRQGNQVTVTDPPGKSTARVKCHGTIAKDGCGPGDALQVE